MNRYPVPQFNKEGKTGTCRWCGGMVSPPARLWHRDCVDEYSSLASSGGIRCAVLQRDHGICWCCELDCEALQRELRTLLAEQRRARRWGYEKSAMSYELNSDSAFSRRVRELGLTGERARLSIPLWEAHHIHRVADVGPAMSLDDLITLCWRCHAKESGRQAKRKKT